MDERRPGSREVIALFPLGTVLLPGAGLPLHVFEPRYRQLLHDLEERDENARCFGVVAIRSGHEVGEGRVRARYDVGTAAVLRDVEWLPDGRARVLAVGGQRFRVLTDVPGAPYDQAEVEWLTDVDQRDTSASAEAGGTTPVRELVAAELARYQAAFGAMGPPALPEDPAAASWAVAGAMVLDLADRQALLEAPDPTSRLRAEHALLRREIALVRTLRSRPAVELPRDPGGLN